MTEPQISDEAVELLARAISAEARPWLWQHVSHESDRQMWRGEARELLGDLVPLLYQQWEAERLGPVRAVVKHARQIRPSPSMTCYVADVERALGLDAPTPHKLGGSDGSGS